MNRLEGLPGPIRLTVLLQDLEYGGTQRYALHLLRHLNRDLFAPELWVLRGGADMGAELGSTGIRVCRLTDSTRVGPRSLFGLARELHRRPPDILYTLTVVPNIWGRIFGRVLRVPVIISGYRSLYPKQFERRLWPLSDRIICNADALREIMVGRFAVDPSRIAVVPNGVDADHFAPRSEARSPQPLVLSVGRLVPDKDPFTLVKAFDLVARRFPEATFIILGNGHLKRRVEQRIADMGLTTRIRLVPGTDDIRPHLAEAWAFTMASVREASPNVIIEAMAMELPVAATKVGGIPELVAEGATGFLAEPGNPVQLADGLIRLIENEHLRQSMGRRARERVLLRHTIEHMVRATERVFLDALAGKQTP